MKKESCFKCGCEDVEVFEAEKIIIFRCNLCFAKWGEYNTKEV